jgi:hypothetical protein
MPARFLAVSIRNLVIAALAVSAAAESARSDPSPQAPAIEAHTRFLAHDLLEGRDTGTRGYDLAAAYVAAQFSAAGLEPAGTEDGWFQPFTVRRRTLDATEIRYLAEDGPVTLINGQDVALDASPDATDERLDLELVFVGWGRTTTPGWTSAARRWRFWRAGRQPCPRRFGRTTAGSSRRNAWRRRMARPRCSP